MTGRLYKLLWETYTHIDGTPVDEILDEAKKEFPIWFGNIPPCERCKRYEPKVMEWFKKWFILSTKGRNGVK